ncbi:MAG: nicotinate (nicotinamide) nucleotide adenylyltransferase [Candidatus Levybacteria bacterium]|nr:nicotinate (nicotinamide) nucleotide adenylyltransferase [Candidatus Levybacteria bacterium]
MKIAILGSSFDPPHIGHALIATQVKELFKMDEVWLMPSFIHPFGKKLSSSTRRLEMTALLEDNGIKASDFEIRQKKTSYTIDTLNLLIWLFPKDQFYWIIGSDQLNTFNQWKKWQDLVKKYPLIIFPRETDFNKIEEQIKSVFKIKKIPSNIFMPRNKNLIVTNISSTMVRDRIKERKEIKYLVPVGVEKYITEHGLYK